MPVLQFIHTGKVIHRDIKPENIIRRQVDKKLVLVDFGAAKVASRTALQKTGTTIGSAGYAAPEQAFGKVLFSSDIYSLGVTCLNLLTNVNPLEMYDPMEGFAWQKFLQDRKIRNTLCKILDKMTQPIAKYRYQSVDNVLKDLQKPASSQLQPIANVAKVIQKTTSSQPQSVANVAKVIQPQQISAKPPINKIKSTPKQSQAIIKVFSPKSATRSTSISLPSSSPSQSAKLSKSSFSRSLTLDCGEGSILEMVKVGGGSFYMGSNDYDIFYMGSSNYTYESEKPIHQVRLKGFLIGKYPVTQAQYKAVMGNNPSKFNGDQNPVEKVSWHNAMEFCRKLSLKTGRKVRLPSESEWEYAAKGGKKSKGYEYAGSNNLDAVGWYSRNSGGKTQPVGQKEANELGIYDMSGNVWEWCLDNWYSNYQDKPDRLKNDGNEPWSYMNTSKNDNRSHLLRGGSWFSIADYCRSTSRLRGIDSSLGDRSDGFRIVLPLF